jgi:hypothetical protein
MANEIIHFVPLPAANIKITQHVRVNHLKLKEEIAGVVCSLAALVSTAAISHQHWLEHE